MASLGRVAGAPGAAIDRQDLFSRRMLLVSLSS